MPGAGGGDNYKWWAFSAIAISFFTQVMSMSMVFVALSSIADDFGVTLREVSWVVIAQALTISALMMPMGRLADIVGRKRIHLFGLLVYCGGALTIVFAPTFGALIIARVVMATGNAMGQSVGTAMVVSVFPPAERGRAIGAQTTAVSIGGASGPIVGGLVLQWLPWEALFLLIPATGSTHSMLATSDPDRIDIAFDDDRLVADAGLLLPATLAQHLGLQELADSCVDLGDAPGRANAGDKLLTLVASALAGGECIDDAAALRAGGTASVLGCTVKAPSTLGVFLRSFSWGHVRQLDRVSRKLLARAWAAGAGPGAAPFTIDLDSTLCETYGLAKEGARQHGYTGVRGYHPLLAVAAGTGDVLMARLREGRANTARGAAHFLRETVGRVRAAGASGELTVRADSGFYNHAVVAVCRKQDVRFSITIRQQPSVRTLIEAIAEEDWTPIPYWLPGGADVAETTYTPFQHKEDATPVRLIVRRVKPTPGSQLALFVNYSYHAFITDRAGEMMELEAGHRRHAEIENAIRDLKYGVGLNHLPSGRFGANAAWLAVQVIAHNLARWTARLGLGAGIVTTRTLRRRYFALAGRLTHSARRWTLHLAKRWPWAGQWAAALARLRALPLPA